MKSTVIVAVTFITAFVIGIGSMQLYHRPTSTEQGQSQVAAQPKIAPASPKRPVDALVVCDKFNLVTEAMGSTLELSVDTDMPDNAAVMVSVSRSYWEKGSPDAYRVDYFSEKSVIGKWKSKHRISIDNGKWKSALKAEQEEMSRLGIGFDVASISDKITACMIVPIHQPDPRFGEQNSNLTGKAVRTTGIRVVMDEVEIDYPLNSPPVLNSPFPENTDHAISSPAGPEDSVSRDTAIKDFRQRLAKHLSKVTKEGQTPENKAKALALKRERDELLRNHFPKGYELNVISRDKHDKHLLRELESIEREAIRRQYGGNPASVDLDDLNQRLDRIESVARSRLDKMNRKSGERGYSLSVRKEAAYKTLVKQGYSPREAQLTVDAMVEHGMLPDPPLR